MVRVILAAGAIFISSMQVAAAGCGPDQYFAASDYDHKTPLAKPERDFADDLRRAKAGDHLAQRNVAVSYETGYLVSRCDEQALFWYGKAAKGGDKEAQKWVTEHDEAERMAAGPSCVGTNCGVNADTGAQQMTLVARGAHGHFYTTLTINGVSVDAVIDTGASTVAISAVTASRMGISPQGFTQIRVGTANGVTTAYNKTIAQLQVGQLMLSNVEISVVPNTTGTLIGMSALRQLKVDVNNGYMTLSK